MSLTYDYYNPTTIHFGKDQISKITGHLAPHEKILVIYGGGSIKKNGAYDQVAKALEGYTWCEFSGVEPNPTYETLNKAVAMVKENDITTILAVGGGSVIDGSKYVAAAACYAGDGWDFLEGKAIPQQAIALGCVLTLPATGSESNSGAVITKAATKEKRFFHSPLVYPKFAVLDPSFMQTLSDRQLANGLVDAFVHTCEQYLTMPNTSLLHDGYSETILQGLVTLADSWDSRHEPLWQENLMLLANQALNGFIGTGVAQDWATHMIGHELTAFYGVDHAQSLAIVQPQLLRVMMADKALKLEQFGKNVFGIEGNMEKIIEEIEAMYHKIGVKTKLSDYDTCDERVLENILPSLEKHGMTAIGERGNITLEVSKQILEMAI